MATMEHPSTSRPPWIHISTADELLISETMFRMTLLKPSNVGSYYYLYNIYVYYNNIINCWPHHKVIDSLFDLSKLKVFRDLRLSKPSQGSQKNSATGTVNSPSFAAFSQAPRAPWKLVNSYQTNPWENFTLNTSHPLLVFSTFFPNNFFPFRIQTWRFDNRIIHLSVDPWSNSRNL